MPLGTDVGLGPDRIVLDGNLAPSPERGIAALTFWPIIAIVAKRVDGSRCHLVCR